MSREKQEKVLALLEYIRQICVLQYKTVTDIEKQEWVLYLDKLESEAGGIRFFAGKDEDGSEILLDVGRPKFSPCPALPDALAGWIATPRWEDFHVDEVKVHSELTKTTEQMGSIVMRFHDSERRVRNFSEWKKARLQWRKKERLKQQAKQLFDDLYRIYERCRRDGGKMELMAGNGFFYSGLDSRLHHPLLLKKVHVRYTEKEHMQLVDAREEPEFYAEFFLGQEDVGEEALRAAQRKVGRSGLHPLQKDVGEALLKDMASLLSPKCRYAAEGFHILPTDWYILYARPVLFLRRKHSRKERLLSGIMERIADKGDVPLPLLDIVDAKALERSAACRRETLADARGESEDILLVKSANVEQIGIARKLEESSAVVVQGPPGTGKTHTIANLLGHFLARGNRVLVTSPTPKALRILKDMLPEGIRNLCVSLQGDSYRDLERSVEGICDVLGSSTTEDMEYEAQEARRKWKEARKMLGDSREKAAAVRRMERRRDFFSFGGEAYSLSEMARFVHEHEHLLEIVPGKVGEGKAIPLTTEELALLYASNGLFSRQDMKEMAENLPKSGRLLSPVDVENLLQEQEILGERERGLLQELPDWSVEEEHIFYRHEQVVADFQMDAFLTAEADYRQIDFAWMESVWAREAVLAGRQGGTARMAWEQLGEDIRRVRTCKDAAVIPLLGRSVECPEEIMYDERVLRDLSDMREAFARKGNLSILQKILHGSWRRLSQKILVDGHGLRSDQDCMVAERYLSLQQARRRVQQEWDHLLGRCGEPTYEELWISSDDVDDICSARWEQIHYCLDWYDNRRESFQKHLDEAGVKLEKILPEDERFMTPRQQMAMEIHWLQESWPQCAALVRLECIEKQALMGNFRKRVAELAERRSQLAKRLAVALQGGSSEAYRKDYDKLLHYESLMDKFKERTDFLARLASVAPDWAAAIARQHGSAGMAEVPVGLEDAWKCRQFVQQLAKVAGENMADLDGSLHRQLEQLHEITAGLVEKLAWRNFFREVADSGIRATLMSWSRAVKKAGRDAGKNISRRVRMARKQTMELQSTVPVWIMPLDKVWDNLQPESRKFDVIIMDEASQADITSLPLLYFGHKVIVVGDDKQVAPDPIGLSEGEVSGLGMPSLFEGDGYANPYVLDNSLYDIARMYFETRMFKEHFRSVPEIIGYSNQLVYQNLIQPLRESGGSALKPVVSYEVDGVRDGERPVNWKEAEEIVLLMMACMEQPEYEGKTFGAISLLGDAQGRLIREIALRRIGIPRLEERNFLSGNPMNFQGDERDVIFLSMVDDAASVQEMDSGKEPADAEKRNYNVAASRARDQLWVLHSMEIEELEEGGLRRGLLEYAAAPEDSMMLPDGRAAGDSVPTFHHEVAQRLRQRGFRVEERWPVGSYRIDMAVLSHGRRVAVSCEGEDGENDENRLLEAQKEQAVLERLGWVFLRLRGSRFYRSPESAMDDMEEELRRYGILPMGKEDIGHSAGKAREELLARVLEAAARIREEWRREDLLADEKNEKSA